jgi:hypothetical protein
LALAPAPAAADELAGVTASTTSSGHAPTSTLPPATEHYFQYGAGLLAEMLLSNGSVCGDSSAGSPCVLGPGAGVGLAIRAGYRTRGPFYVGGAYAFSRQDSSNILRLAVLQQLKAEARYYFVNSTRFTPYFLFAAGMALYGNEWGADTWGLSGGLGVGGELEISRSSVVGASLAYTPIVLRHWEDGTGQVRADVPFGFGIAHFLGLELVFEVRDPLSRW